MKKHIFYAILIIFFISVTTSKLNAQCWKETSCGDSYVIALKTDGTLWAWGLNNFGQLGDGTFLNTNTPIQIGIDNDWVEIGGGYFHSLAIKSNGTLWAWGWNAYGQLGDGTFIDRSTPTQIGAGINWKKLGKGGWHHSLAIKTDGTLWGWGDNVAGQTGTGLAAAMINLPTQIGFDNNWSLTNAGRYHSMAIKTDGTLWTWGANWIGQLGDGTYVAKNMPIQIGNSINWKSVAGGQHTICTKTDGTLWTWGMNIYGQLGDGTNIDKNIPTQIGLSTNWDIVSSGERYSSALKNDGSAWSWGNNANFGELGIGNLIDQNTPTLITNSIVGTKINSGPWNSQIIDNTNDLYSWGASYSGSIGDGTNIDRYSPVLINCGLTELPCFATGTTNLTVGLLAYYPFGGGSLNDFSGNGQHLTNTTTANPTFDRNGNLDCAFSFRKSDNEFLRMTSASFLNSFTTSPFTISLWYKPIGTRPVSDYEQLVGRDAGLNCPDTYGQWSLGLYDCRKSVMGFDMYSHWQTSNIPDCNLLLTSISNNWHHVAFVFDGISHKLYTDGLLDINASGPCGSLSANLGDLFIGKEFTGDIDDILIYNRPLSGGEISQLQFLGSSCCTYAPLGSNENEELVKGLNIKIYPNPVSSIINIETQEKIVSKTIFDLSGKIIKNISTPQNYVETGFLIKGVYFIKIKTNKENYHLIFIKE